MVKKAKIEIKVSGVVAEEVSRKRRKVVMPARYKMLDTGRKHIVQVKDEEGQIFDEERPIMEKVFMEAVIEEEDVTVPVFAVYTGEGEARERHEFTEKEKALAYLKGFK